MTAEDRLRHLVAACEMDAILCVVCRHQGVRRDAITRVLLSNGHKRPSCSEHANYPTTVNGVDQVVGLEPITQPQHVVAARTWATTS